MTLSTTSGFPTSLDALTDPTSTDKMNGTDIEHDLLHQLENDAIEHLQTKVGIDSSAVTTSHDYKLSGVTGTDKAVSKTGTETLTNKTLTTARLNTPNFNEAVNMTASSTELNFLDTSVAGTSVAGKAAVLGSNKELDEFHTAALYIGAGAGTQVTSTAAEVNITDGGDTTEKVLNVNCKCKAYLSSSMLNLTDGNITKILLDAESYDIGSDFDTTNSRFVAPVTGYYLIIGNIYYTQVIADKSYYCYIYVNNAEYSRSIGGTGGAVDIAINNSVVAFVTAGQYIELYGRVVAGVSTVDVGGGATITYLCVHLLSV